MYKDVEIIINLLNEEIKSIVTNFNRVGADWRIPKNTLEEAKKKILENYELSECYSCGKIFEKTENLDNFCSPECLHKEHLEAA